MDGRELRLIELLAQLQQLNPTLTGDDDVPLAGRLSLRAGDGSQVGGDALLSDKALDALNAALASMLAYAQAERQEAAAGLPCDEPVEFELTGLAGSAEVLPDLNPAALADLEDHFDGIDSGSFLADAEMAADKEAGGHAFDRLVLGDAEGDL